MLVYSLFAIAHAETVCEEPSNIDAAVSDASGIAVHVDGSLLVLPSEGDRVSVIVCGGDARLIRRDTTLDLTSRGDPVSVTVYLPASIRALTLHERKGAAVIRVPARVALVSSEGPAEVAAQRACGSLSMRGISMRAIFEGTSPSTS